MTASVFIPGPLPGFNEIIAAAKSGRGKGNAYARMKKQWGETVWAFAKSARMKPVDGQASVLFVWFERDRRRDIDNVSAAAKFVLDGLVKAGVLANDNQASVFSIEHHFVVDKKTPGVRVTVEPACPF